MKLSQPQSRLLRFLLTLAIGIIGGFLFSAITAPLPWMLGPLTLTALGSIAGLRLFIPPSLRALVSSIIGLMLGSAFTPEMLATMSGWLPSLCVLLFLGVVTTTLGAVCFYKFGRYDTVSAYFSAAPGGLSDMTIIGGAMGGNERLISFSHTIRLLAVVSFIPLWFRFSHGYINPGMTQAMGSLAMLRGIDVAVLTACAVIGFLLARLIRLPAPALMGPLLLSAAVHGAGLSRAHPPGEFVLTAQIFLGCAIGCRFSGVSFRSMLRPLIVGIVAATVTLLCCFLGVSGLWWAKSLTDFISLFLAFSPGGLSEMAMIAIALNADVAFVSTHHFVRIFAVLLFAPLAFRVTLHLFPKLGKKSTPPA